MNLNRFSFCAVCRDKQNIFAVISFSLSFLLIYVLRNYFLNQCQSVYYRIYYWKCVNDFFLFFAGLFFVFITYVMLDLKKIYFSIFRSISLSMILVSLFSFGIHRPVPIRWASSNVEKIEELKKNLETAKKKGSPVLVYFHADWCLACDDFERYVLGRPEIRPAIDRFYSVRVDVTEFDYWHEYLEQKFGVDAVPSVGFVDRSGNPLPHASFTGEHVPVSVILEIFSEVLK